MREFVGIQIQGSVIPPEILAAVSGGEDLPGSSSADYHLAAGETLREAANRVWAYLTGVWAAFREQESRLPEGDLGTTLTRERWLLILLDQLGYGRLPASPSGGIKVDGKSVPVSHLWERVPIHLLGAGVDLDRRQAGVRGAASSSPQSMVQELLNRSNEHLWAILSNGHRLRLLRDSTSLVGSAYVEFDLEAIFDGDLFSDFVVLYGVCHQSRVEVLDAEVGPASCWLERWRTEGIQRGTRALNQLRDGVVTALEHLGSGFRGHPANDALRARFDSGELSLDDYNHALLRVVYRLLCTFVAEDRGVLLDPAAQPEARSRYVEYFSSARLRRSARRRPGSRHGDKWATLVRVWSALGSVDGEPRLGLRGIGGLFEDGPLDVLGECALTNQSLHSAVRALSVTRDPKTGAARVVDYRHLGAEELGSIYESLLEFVPSWDATQRRYRLGMAAGNQRKTTGSYYTPTSLIDSLLDTALDPVLDRAAAQPDPEAALLTLTVVDPACGSGHFLVAAARRIAKRLAAVRTGDPEPPPEQVRQAVVEVVSRCIFGVDVNPLSAELAKVSLWLESMAPGQPMPFLDSQIRVGNALIGATPALITRGVPDAAFTALDGDDKKTVTRLKKENKNERDDGAQGLFDVAQPAAGNTELAEQMRTVTSTQVSSLLDVHVQRGRLQAYEDSDEYRRRKRVADAWCAAFVWPKAPGAPTPITTGTLRRLDDGQDLDPGVSAELDSLVARYRFFHWHLEFPQVFPVDGESVGGEGPGWSGGFDVVLGNPPWEHIELKEQEYFDARDPDIAQASGAKRKRLIKELDYSNPVLAGEYKREKRRIDGFRHFAATSGNYPLCGVGRIKTDPLFAEQGRVILTADGRFGMVLPTGIATDFTTRDFFKDLVVTGALASLFDFENREKVFPAVDSRQKFALLTLAGRATRVPQAEFAFFLHDAADLARDGVRFELTPEEITLLNPNTGTCPIFRTRRDAEITLGIYRRVPVLVNENDPENGNPWGVSFKQGLFNMTSDSHLFHTREELEDDGWVLNGNVFEREIDGGYEVMQPLYEAKMIHHFDTRWATYELDGSI